MGDDGKMYKLICAFLTLASMVGILVTSNLASAQDAGSPTANVSTLQPYTFAGPFSPSPDQCATEPISTDVTANLLATPVAKEAPEVTTGGTIAIPSGSPADVDSTTAVLDVLTQLWACNNARDLAAVLGNMTDKAIQATFGSSEASSWNFSDLRSDVAAALTPGEPRTTDELASIDGITSVLQHDDDRIGVLVLNSDPLVADGQTVLDYFAFELADSGYKVDEIILDPFDLTPGYGFEASA
jgi:hypothetical protein